MEITIFQVITLIMYIEHKFRNEGYIYIYIPPYIYEGYIN